MKKRYMQANDSACRGLSPLGGGPTPHGDVPVPHEASFTTDAPRHPARERRGNAWPLISWFVAWLLLPCGCAFAQNFAIDWFTFDGGGGTSTGGVYSVTGTVGQPDAGQMSGGNYSIEGGFWGVVAALQTPGAPLLSITRPATNTVVVSWPSPSTGFVLQQNPDLNTTNWADVAQTPVDDGTTKTVTVNPPVGKMFYRLRKL